MKRILMISTILLFSSLAHAGLLTGAVAVTSNCLYRHQQIENAPVKKRGLSVTERNFLAASIQLAQAAARETEMRAGKYVKATLRHSTSGLKASVMLCDERDPSQSNCTNSYIESEDPTKSTLTLVSIAEEWHTAEYVTHFVCK